MMIPSTRSWPGLWGAERVATANGSGGALCPAGGGLCVVEAGQVARAVDAQGHRPRAGGNLGDLARGQGQRGQGAVGVGDAGQVAAAEGVGNDREAVAAGRLDLVAAVVEGLAAAV